MKKKLQNICLALVVAVILLLSATTFFEKYRGTDWAFSHVYGSVWFTVMWILLVVAALFLLLLRRVSLRPAVLCLHFSFVVILSGALLTRLTAHDGVIHLKEGIPTSDYLTGKNGAAATYREDFSLRGMKQYWLHDKEAKGGLGNNKEVGSDFYPYPQGTSFTGQIRFTNLSEEELGMLLWSLILEKNSQQNIGKGKPYGYGRIAVSLKQLKILNPDALYGGDTLCLEPYQDQKGQWEEYVAKAKKNMTQFLGKDVMEYPPVRDFLLMKNVDEIPDDSKTHYMSIEGRESDYQERTKNQIPLDTIGVVLGKEKRKAQPSGSQGGGYRGNSNYGGQKKSGYGGNKNWNGLKNSDNGGNKTWKGQKKSGQQKGKVT